MHILFTIQSLKDLHVTKSDETTTKLPLLLIKHQSPASNYDRFLSTKSHLNRIGSLDEPALDLQSNGDEGSDQQLPPTIQLAAMGFDASDPDFASPVRSMSVRLGDGETVLELDEDMVKQANEYGVSAGQSELRNWLRLLQERVHGPLRTRIDVAIGHGTRDLLVKLFDMFLSPGDVVLMETPTHTGTIRILNTLQVQCIEIPMDQDGLVVSRLESMLMTWRDPTRRPKLLYTIPSGQSPTGLRTSLERKRAVYELVCRFDLLIIEDDPYYYLQAAGDRVPSYMSLDRDPALSRVIRLDSMSFVLSPGLRIGWATAHPDIIDQLAILQCNSIRHASGYSQLILYALLNQWGIPGWMRHVDQMAWRLQDRMDRFCKLLANHKQKNEDQSPLYEFTKPPSGIFLWVRCLPLASTLEPLDANGDAKAAAAPRRKRLDCRRMVTEMGPIHKLILIPGSECFPHAMLSDRVCLSVARLSPDQMEEAAARFADMVRQWQRHDSVNVSACSSTSVSEPSSRKSSITAEH